MTTVNVSQTTGGITQVAYTGAYQSGYPYELVTHGEPNANSIFFDTAFATNGPVKWRVDTDYDSGIVVVDHAALDAAEDELNDVSLHSTDVAEGSSTATYGYFVPESGATGTWQATITVSEPGQVPQGVVTIGTITKDTNSASIPFSYNDTDQTGFEHSEDGGPWNPVTSPISRTDLPDNTPHSGQIRAVNASGAGTAASYSFTTDAAPIEPQVPQGVITFSFPVTDQTSVQAHFQYSLSDQTGFEYSLDGGAAAGTGKPVSISGLSQSTTYGLRVRAINATGNGEWFFVSFRTKSEPAPPAEDNWPFSKGIRYKAITNWEWGKRHPTTNMRVRIFK